MCTIYTTNERLHCDVLCLEYFHISPVRILPYIAYNITQRAYNVVSGLSHLAIQCAIQGSD